MIYAENILICIAIPLLIALLFIRGSARRFVLGFVAGMVTCLLAAYISSFLGYVANFGDQTSVYLSPVVEEIMKLIPLVLYIFVTSPDEESLFLMAIGVGTGFATFENCCYILSFGAGDLPYIMIRGLAVGVMHLVCVMMLGMGLIIVKRFRAMSFPGIFGALSLSMSFHGLYNLLVSKAGVTSSIGYALPLLMAALLYHPFRRLRETESMPEPKMNG